MMRFKKFIIFVIIVVTPICLRAMEEDRENENFKLVRYSSSDEILFQEKVNVGPFTALNKSGTNITAIDGDDKNSPERIGCGWIISRIFRIISIFDGCMKSHCMSKKPGNDLLTKLPTELLIHISNFLNSVSILRLSGTNQKLRQIFDEKFWQNYSKKLPRACSYLTLNGPLSPSSRRKEFFSHVWYREGRIALAAKLNHPEAEILYEYAKCGISIERNQYVRPFGVIKNSNGKIDAVKTKKLSKEKMKKLEVVRNFQLNLSWLPHY